MQNAPQSTEDAPFDDQFRAEMTDDVGLVEFVNAGQEWMHNEYIRMFLDPERRQVRLYRKVGDDAGVSECVRTVIEDVDIQINDRLHDAPDAINLHAGNAATVVAFLTALAKERSPARVSIDYWERSGRGMYEGTGFEEEIIIFEYRTESGRQRRVDINSVYKNELQMLARHDRGDGIRGGDHHLRVPDRERATTSNSAAR